MMERLWARLSLQKDVNCMSVVDVRTPTLALPEQRSQLVLTITGTVCLNRFPIHGLASSKLSSDSINFTALMTAKCGTMLDRSPYSMKTRQAR